MPTLRAAASADFTIGDIVPGSLSDADEEDRVVVNIDNSAGGSVKVGGVIHNIDNANSFLELTGDSTVVLGQFSSLGAASVSISGNVTYDFTDDDGDDDITTPPALIRNSGTGLIEIASGATLTIDDTDGSGAPANVLNNNGTNGVTGAGTLVLSGDPGDVLQIGTNPGETQELGNIQADVATEIFDGTGSTTDATDVTVGEVEANAALTFRGLGDLGNVQTGNVTANAAVTFGDGPQLQLGRLT